jgi:FAD/FMN-containing dehydrogenase
MKFIDEIRSALGPAGTLMPVDAAAYLTDVRDTYSGQALLVARPASTSEVATVVRICRRHEVSIVPQGGNTGLCGGAIPGGTGSTVVLSLSRMNRIVALDALRYTVTAEAGCILDPIHEAASQADRLLSLDWGARGSATVGGAVSTNAGGINVLRYGTTRDQVLGLEVVLADGRIWNGLRSLRKNTAGFDMKQVFVGAEGTLGIVTQAVLKLHAKPAHEQSMFAALGDINRLAELFALVRSVAEGELSAFELVSGFLMEKALATQSALTRPVQTRSDWYVLVRLAGSKAIAEKLEEIYTTAAEAAILTDGTLAHTIAQERALWSIREEMIPFKYMKGKMLKWDVSVAIDQIVPFLSAVNQFVDTLQQGATVIAFGHVGDGNLHMTIWPVGDPATQEFQILCERIVEATDRIAWTFGGSICAEHGVGVENVTRLQNQVSAIELELMVRLKRTFDPGNLMNPGKVLRSDSDLP